MREHKNYANFYRVAIPKEQGGELLSFTVGDLVNSWGEGYTWWIERICRCTDPPPPHITWPLEIYLRQILTLSDEDQAKVRKLPMHAAVDARHWFVPRAPTTSEGAPA